MALILASLVYAQPPALKAAIRTSLIRYQRTADTAACFGSQWYLNEEGMLIKFYEQEPMGLKDALEDRSNVGLLMADAYPKVNVDEEIYLCHHAENMRDYDNANACIKVGNGWWRILDEYSTPHGTVRLLLVLEKELYMLMLFTPLPE